MLTVVHDAQEANESTGGAGRSLLDEIVRDGARQMLAEALKAEVAAYGAQFADQLDGRGHRLVVRNGYHQARGVLTAPGAVEVKAPRVNDRARGPDTGARQRFSSAGLPAWARKSSGDRSGTGAVPGIRGWVVGVDDHPPDCAAAGRSRRVRLAGICRTPTTSTYGSTASTSRSA